ncbi:hypothetical protein ABT095_28430 [Kitasatospora sp. NPDC002227]|uniref:hypothetical protein n=1 Tax=Kitasatospora sp. NPDC002227 TaxID=3154773 RepID=UPI00331C437B
MTRRRSPLLATLCLLALALTACASAPAMQPPHEELPRPTVAATARAATVARLWDGSAEQRAWLHGYYPLDPQREWLPPDAFHSGADKHAFQGGRLELRTALPTTGPAPTTLSWADGSTVTLPTLGAAEVYRSMTTDKPGCPDGCSPLLVTAVRPGTREVATSRGQVTVPVWEFTLAGYQQPVAYPAVAPQQDRSTAPPPQIADGTAAGWTSASPDGLTLHGTVPLGGCQVMDSTEAYESDTAVVLIARTHSAVGPGQGCAASVAARPAGFHLHRPLGTRTVLDLGTGLPQLPPTPRRHLS